MRKTSTGEYLKTTKKKAINFEFTRIYNTRHTKILHVVVYAKPVNIL